jgi:hypothetical protein
MIPMLRTLARSMTAVSSATVSSFFFLFVCWAAWLTWLIPG